MFSPTNFPVRAFYVTAALNVRECEVQTARAYTFTRGWYGTDVGEKHETELFADRLGAIAEAGKRLSKMHERYVKAGQRWTKCRATVEALQAEEAVFSAKKGGAA